ncbi:SDR family oxidoreductase [Propioniciclava sinopodophylli]|nr:SDR family oxidoreductase [Propioniciclava sinopodophylli]
MAPRQRIGLIAASSDPHELVPALLYLTSPAASYTTGSDVVVDGGYTLV